MLSSKMDLSTDSFTQTPKFIFRASNTLIINGTVKWRRFLLKNGHVASTFRIGIYFGSIPKTELDIDLDILYPQKIHQNYKVYSWSQGPRGLWDTTASRQLTHTRVFKVSHVQSCQNQSLTVSHNFISVWHNIWEQNKGKHPEFQNTVLWKTMYIRKLHWMVILKIFEDMSALTPLVIRRVCLWTEKYIIIKAKGCLCKRQQRETWICSMFTIAVDENSSVHLHSQSCSLCAFPSGRPICREIWQIS